MCVSNCGPWAVQGWTSCCVVGDRARTANQSVYVSVDLFVLFGPWFRRALLYAGFRGRDTHAAGGIMHVLYCTLRYKLQSHVCTQFHSLVMDSRFSCRVHRLPF